MTKSGPKNQFCKNYQIILLCTYFGYLISSEDLSNISENIYTSRFLWDATANAKIHRRYFISKIFLDLSLILEMNDILKFLSQDSRGMLPQALWDPS